MAKKITDSLSERRKAEDILIANSDPPHVLRMLQKLKAAGATESKDYGETLVLPMGKAL